MSQYLTGSVDTTSGSNVVTGTGTAWLANVSVGDIILFDSIEGTPYWVSAVNSDTELEVSANLSETLNDDDYVIVRDFTYNNSLPLLNPGDARAAEIYNVLAAKIDVALALVSGLNPGIPAGNRIYLDSPTNTVWIQYNASTGQIEFYRNSAFVGAM